MRKFLFSYSLNPASKQFQNSEELRTALIEMLLRKACALSSNEEGVILMTCDKTYDAVKAIIETYDDDIFYTLAQVAKIDAVQKVNIVSNYTLSLYFDDEVAKIKRNLRLKG